MSSLLLAAYLFSGAPANEYSRAYVVELHAGAGTPYGLVGVSADLAPTPWLVLGAGVGTNALGLQLVFSPRLRLIADDTIAFDLGAGVSTGRYIARDGLCGLLGHGSCQAQRTAEHAVWANFEAALVARFPIGFQLRPYVGYGRLVNPDALVCKAEETCTDGGLNVIFAGGAVGYVF